MKYVSFAGVSLYYRLYRVVTPCDYSIRPDQVCITCMNHKVYAMKISLVQSSAIIEN